MGCLFCGWLEDKNQILWEDDKIVVFVGNLVYTEGHLLVCPKQHYESIYDVPDDVKLGLFITSLDFGKKLKEKLNAVGFHISLSEKIYLAEPNVDTHVPHIHMHVIPRRLGEKSTFQTRLKLKQEKIQEIIDKISS